MERRVGPQACAGRNAGLSTPDQAIHALARGVNVGC